MTTLELTTAINMSRQDLVSFGVQKVNKPKINLLFAFFVIGSIFHGLGAILLVLWMLVLFIRSNFVVRNNLVISCSFVLLFCTLFFSFYPGLRYPLLYIEEIIKQLSWVALAYIGSTMNKNEVRYFYKLFLISIFLTLPLIFIVPVRFKSYFPHSNHLAYYTLIPLITYLFDSNSQRKWIVILMLFFIVVITLSSGGIAVFLATVFLYFIFDQKIKFKTFLQLFLLVSLMGSIVYFTGIFDAFYNKISIVDFQEISERADRGALGSESSLVWRMTYWTMLIREFMSQPISTILLGEGVKTMAAGNYLYDFMARDPHNDYVRLFIERGLIGSVFFLFFLIKMVLTVDNKFILLFILLTPMFSGNIVVSFPFTFSLIILLSVLNSDKRKLNDLYNE
ncbi:O-antigen ligase family protein [Algoriphagus sp.]|uniref:O-antigen ligase family protein n=1 Tax=Algoriphagus sp. TaxID=1872435 RepID=UPI003F6F1D2E